jgi:hypothetical protein
VRRKSEPERALREKRDEIQDSALKKALAGEAFSENIERLKDHDALLERVDQSKSKPWTSILFIAAACIALAGLGWLIPIHKVNLHVSLRTDAMTFELAKDWSSNDAWRMQPGSFRLDGFEEIQLPPELAPLNKLDGRAWLDLDKGVVTVVNFQVSKGARLSVLASEQAIYLLSAGAPLRGQAYTSGETWIRGGDAAAHDIKMSQPIAFDVPATFSFYDRSAATIPAQLIVTPRQRIVLRDIPIQSLSFSREETSTAAPTFVSGISSGTVVIGETGEKIVLSEATRLHLGSPDGAISKLEIRPGSLLLTFEGTASSVSVGTAGFDQSKIPSVLGYLYHQEHLTLFAGAIAFLWSMFWGIKQRFG